ncbi:MAG: hypothetical protein JO353_10430 [Phycisphaerae bacterium]|nr:hypothetical protein [Phycisphaerae bacterium]
MALPVFVAAGLLICGCRFNVGNPTDQEVQQMQAWAAVVTPKDRADVMRQANQHTEWAERRKVQWITGEYKKRYEHYQARAAATRAASSATTSGPSPVGGL